MMTLIAAAALAAPVSAAPAAALMTQHVQHQQGQPAEKDCCKDCCKDMAAKHDDHSAEPAGHNG